ncbi:MAG: ABC transporter ATP-binding protein, partial [Acidobacteriota bacterium]
MSRSPFIRFEKLEKSFAGKAVLRGIDLEVQAGETVVVLGGSGTGKSVLLKHTIGLLRPDAGRVFVDGLDVTGFDEDRFLGVRKKVGMLFQGGALFDSMDVRDNVAYALYEHTNFSEERIDQRVHEVLAQVELPGVENLMPVALSGG